MLQHSFSDTLSLLKNRLLALVKTPVCCVCQAVLNTHSTLPKHSGFCTSCLRGLTLRDWHPVDKGHAVYAATTLTPPLKHWIYGYKFYQKTEFLAPLSGLLTQTIASNMPLKSLVLTAIPPHRSADDHASHFLPVLHKVATNLNLPVETGLLRWQRETTPQHKLNERSERLHNMADALQADEAVRRGYPPETRWLVLDDLTTTGATLREALRAIADGLPSNLLTGLALAHVPR